MTASSAVMGTSFNVPTDMIANGGNVNLNLELPLVVPNIFDFESLSQPYSNIGNIISNTFAENPSINGNFITPSGVDVSGASDIGTLAVSLGVQSSVSVEQLSVNGSDLLKGIEQLRLQPYDDGTGKTISDWVEGATIGYGHYITQSDWSLYQNGISEEEANTLFAADVSPFEEAVHEKLGNNVNQNQFDAAVIFAFNIGIPAFKSSSVAKLINDPNAITSYNSLEDAWKAWNKDNGIVIQGLVNRRNAEWNIYSQGVYQNW